MFRLIFEKELREIISSAKFAITFGICSILILLTFFIGAKNHHVNQFRHEAAKAENLRQMEGLTDWLRVNSHRVFLPPSPLESLVSGTSSDIGRNIEMTGRGELTANDSRFNNDPIFAVFRFLDLDFIFQIVLSLFAILFAFDAINGEKESGTLRLSFANPVPRDKYILGKLVGSFVALAVPLLIPILLGCLLLPIMGVLLSGDEWARLAMVILSGILYFGVFLTLSVFVSSRTQSSSTSFLLLLVIWIFAVLIIPRTSVLLAGRMVDVPSVDEIASQKSRLRRQLWTEDRGKMAHFKPGESMPPEKMIEKFNAFMQDLADERDKKMSQFASQLNEERHNRQNVREKIAYGFARISPSASFSLAATNLVGTSLALKDHFLEEAQGYQKTYAEFMKEKTGMNLGGGVMLFRMSRENGERVEEEPIDPNELPPFQYETISLPESLQAAMLDMGLLALFNIIFFASAFVSFLKYDVR